MSKRWMSLLWAISQLCLLAFLIGVTAEHVFGLSRHLPSFVMWTIGVSLALAMVMPFIVMPFTLTWEQFKAGDSESVLGKSPVSMAAAAVLLMVYFGILLILSDYIEWNVQKVASVGLAILLIPMLVEEGLRQLCKFFEWNGGGASA